ncbi:MAG: hypothetical protein GY711_02570 [bacterium]|nr:hypothetical protein [bacterium]
MNRQNATLRRAWSAWSLLALLTAAAAQERAPSPEAPAPQLAPPADVSDWQSRDDEGRWSLIVESLVGKEPGAIAQWIPFLARERAHRQLEWIITTRSLGTTDALTALFEADTPGWLRAAAWRVESLDSHNRDGAKTLIEKKPGLYVAWVQQHRAAVSLAAHKLADRLKEQNPALPAADVVERYAPPWTPADMYGPLAIAAAAQPLPQGRRAVQGMLYEQQVERAIDAMATRLRRPSGATDTLAKIAAGANERLALHAILAFSNLASNEVPDRALFGIAADTTRTTARREAAFLGATYGSPMRVFVHLHEVAKLPADPHWTTALSRLSELGNGFTVLHLRGIGARPSLTQAQSALLDAHAQKIDERAKIEVRDMTTRSRAWIEYAAYADLQCASIEGPLARWTIATLRGGLDQEQMRSTLEAIRDQYEADPEATTLFGDLGQRVREYAKRVLE